MLTRRELFDRTAALGAACVLTRAAATTPERQPDSDIEVNDVQSQLNRTILHRIVTPRSMDAIENALSDARKQGRPISIAGGRHAMGGQQFGSGAMLLDMKQFNRVTVFDRIRGHVTVESGIEWPELIAYLQHEQAGQEEQWAIRQKQTGVDRVSIGGSLASNIHGRGLRFPPFSADIESFVLLDAEGKTHTCSRRENTELFSLAIGGYGLFGVVPHVTLRLAPRVKLRRIVEVITVKDLLPALASRIDRGFVYGDCQYATSLHTDAYSHPGVFTCYQPVERDTPIPAHQKQLAARDWADLYVLARTDKPKAFERYSRYYVGTSGQVYWSDTNQLAGTFDGHRQALDKKRGTEVITEVYVPRDAFVPFMARCRQDFIDHRVDMTYGTIRFIEKDEDSFLAWATEPWVCIVCNLHVIHTDDGTQKAADFRRIIDRAIEHGGRYFLTYHRWAERRQVESCYPRFVDFLRLKRKYDPDERFRSDWYRHYRSMFADRL